MEDVRIYDYEFNLLHIEHDIVSCNWTIYENAIGTFEMHFQISSRLTEVIADNRYLVAVQGAKQAIITGWQLETEGILYGRSCNWILTRFCTAEQFDTDSLYEDGTIAAKDAQTICEYIYGKTLSDIENFVFHGIDINLDNVYVENKSVASAYDLMRDCLDKAKAGHKVLFDIQNRQWILQITHGKKIDILLSEGNRNAHSMEYSEDMQNYFSGGWYEQEMQDMGEWDAETNTPHLSNNQTGNYATAYRVTSDATRFGIAFVTGDYIVCNNKAGAWSKAEKIENFMEHIPSPLSGIYAWETQIGGSAEQEAGKELSQKKIEKTIKATTYGLVYGRDYALGDMIRTEIIKGTSRIAETQRITGVNLWYEDNDIGEQPIMEGAS